MYDRCFCFNVYFSVFHEKFRNDQYQLSFITLWCEVFRMKRLVAVPLIVDINLTLVHIINLVFEM